jgi:acetoacetyl-CoA synthetase
MAVASPEAETVASPPQLAEFRQLLERVSGRDLGDPVVLHRFSVDEPELFWGTLLDWTGLPWSGSAEPVLTSADVETARFFPGVRLNYAEALLRPLDGVDDDAPALTGLHADRPADRYTRRELRDAVDRAATALARLGVASGDRVVVIAPNTAQVVVTGLAVAALGATLSTATPDMGAPALLGRFEQVEPVVVLLDRTTMDDAAAVTASLVAGLPTARALVLLDAGALPDAPGVDVHRWLEIVAATEGAPPADWPRSPFDHPLFVMFSSGTTGPPKAMVHGAGGTLLEHVKEHRLHGDLQAGETLYFHTTTAWMMWNWQLSALAVGAHVVVFDGPITGPATLWEIAAAQRVNVLGTSPPYLQMCQDEGYRPADSVDLTGLRAVLSTGAVLNDWQFDWVAEAVGPQPLQSISGGTDIIGCFVLGHPELPVRRGRAQARSLGMDTAAVDDAGAEVAGTIGELVCRRPFPSRPVGFLRDPDGARFHAAYFADHEGVWTHGDLVEFDGDGSARLHGRADGVLNIDGVRIGPAEIYTALRAVPAVSAAMAVEQRDPARPGASRMVLLVVLAPGSVLDGALDREIRRTLRRRASAAHVPSLVLAVPALPTTHNGKLSERAARDAVNGDPVANRAALRNPGALDALQAAVQAATVLIAPSTGPKGVASAVGQIWRETLGLASAEPDDNFFDLGGTSRQLTSLLRRVRDELGVHIGLGTFAARPTLAQLLDSVTATATMDTARLLRAGEGPPLFLVTDPGARPADYAALIGLLDTGRPVHGLPVAPVDPDGDGPRTVGEAADEVLEALRSAQPDGPYLLVGHRLGGLVAHEVARRLDGDVELLVLVDVTLPAAALTPAQRLRLRWAGRMAALRAEDRSDVLLQRFAERFAPGTLSPAQLADLRTRTAFGAHRPARYDGPALHLGAGRPAHRRAWRRAAPQLVRIELPGQPGSLLDRPSLGELAQRLSAALLPG